MPDGAATTVTFDNRLKYAALVEAARLAESDTQLQAVQVRTLDLHDVPSCVSCCLIGISESERLFFCLVQAGIVEVVGDVLWVYTWSDLEFAICGSPAVDVDQATNRRRCWFWRIVMWRVSNSCLVFRFAIVARSYVGAAASGRRYVLASAGRALAPGPALILSR